jgi:hypothetical protein
MYAASSWSFGCLATALLALSLFASPSQPVLADDPPGANPTCPNSKGCNDGCATSLCFSLGCTGAACTCTNNTYHPDCSKYCECKFFKEGCWCETK